MLIYRRLIVKIFKVPVRAFIHPCREARRDLWLCGTVYSSCRMPVWLGGGKSCCVERGSSSPFIWITLVWVPVAGHIWPLHLITRQPRLCQAHVDWRKKLPFNLGCGNPAVKWNMEGRVRVTWWGLKGSFLIHQGHTLLPKCRCHQVNEWAPAPCGQIPALHVAPHLLRYLPNANRY